VTNRAYKFRIYPTPEQETVLRKTIGSCRFVYNWALAQKREAWVTQKKSISYGETSAAMTKLRKEEGTKWLANISHVSLQQSLRNLDIAFVNFFKRRAGYPTFKARKNGGSARFIQGSFRIKEGNLFLA